MKTSLPVKIAFCLIILTSATAIFAAPGSLDPTFHSTGYHSHGFGFTGSENSDARAVVIQPDGKTVIAATTNDSTHAYIAVARYNVNGALDTTFGAAGTGYVITPTTAIAANAEDIVLQPDGKIIVVGRASVQNSWDFIAVRYNPDGTLDTSFDGDGVVITNMATDTASASTSDRAYSVDIQADGKIVLGGSAFNLAASDDDIALVRYNPNGSLDTTFNGTGKLILRQPVSYEYISAIKIQPDGKIAAVGNVGRFTVYPGSGTDINYDFAAMRFNGDGSPDTTFNGTGQTVISFGDFPDTAYDMILQPDGKIVAAGNYSADLSDTRTALVRFNVNGSLDSTFGSFGKVVTNIAPNGSITQAAALQPDGKIVVGSGVYDNLFRLDVMLIRYHPNGSLDESFGIGGIVKTDLQGHPEVIRDLTIDSYGRIVVTGATQVFAFTARYSGAPVTLAKLGGRVTNAGGRGIAGAVIKLSHPAFASPFYAQTNGFGYYNFPQMPTGNGYSIFISSKRYTFANPNRVIDLSGDTTDVDFVSEQ
jgi:uncharacterized delta-60 repeat protein